MKKVLAILAMVGFLASTSAIMAEEKPEAAAKENLTAKAAEKKVEKKEEASADVKAAKKEAKKEKSEAKSKKEEAK